jgi:phytoene dehydrogenase-like protein
VLAYYRGGFSELAERLAAEVTALGGELRLSTSVLGLVVEDGCVRGVDSDDGVIDADGVIATPALPIGADLAPPGAVDGRSTPYRRVLALVSTVADRGADGRSFGAHRPWSAGAHAVGSDQP